MKLRLLILTIGLFGCVEHNFFVKVFPNGDYYVDYNAHGEKNDLLNHDFPMPSNNKWNIYSTIDSIEAESYDYTANRLFYHKETFPTSFFNSDSIYLESLIQHPTKIKYINLFFVEKYIFDCRIKGRSVNNKYPLITQLISNKDNPPKNWLHESLKYLLLETINQTNLDWNIRPIIEAELNDWFQNHLLSISDSTLFDELEYYKNLGLDIIMQPVTTNLYTKMDSIFKILEDELEITLELDGDSFDYQLMLPGILTSANADTLMGDTLLWSFDLSNFINDDYHMFAQSTIVHSYRIKFAIILTIIMLSSIFFLRFKLNKT